MKVKTHDDFEFPIGYDPSNFYSEEEIFIPIPKYVELILNINTDAYLISNWDGYIISPQEDICHNFFKNLQIRII